MKNAKEFLRNRMEVEVIIDSLDAIRNSLIDEIYPKKGEADEYRIGKEVYLEIPYMRNVVSFLKSEKDAYDKIKKLLKEMETWGKDKETREEMGKGVNEKLKEIEKLEEIPKEIKERVVSEEDWEELEIEMRQMHDNGKDLRKAKGILFVNHDIPKTEENDKKYNAIMAYLEESE